MPEVNLLASNHKKSRSVVIARLLWIIVWNLLARFTPRPFNPWRIFLLKLFGAKIGQRALVFGSVRIDMPWNLVIGDYSAIGKRVWLYNFAKISIGNNTVISQDSTLCTASHDFRNPTMPLFARPITIGNQVWIAAESFIMPGITILEGSVVGARSVVTKDIGSWLLCAGNPCKPIKNRTLDFDATTSLLSSFYL